MSTVLLVEDETEVRELIESALEEVGLAVRSAGTDRSAYAILEKEARSFSLLVADINLGEGTTGFDVARRARKLNPTLNVIYITDEATQVGMFGVEGGEMFPKPFLPRELAERAALVVEAKPRK